VTGFEGEFLATEPYFVVADFYSGWSWEAGIPGAKGLFYKL